MKRIIKRETLSNHWTIKETKYVIQTRFLWIWWDDTCDYFWTSLTVTYKNLDEAMKSLQQDIEKTKDTQVYP